MENLYEMKLHEDFDVWRDFNVVRVPGGWLYRTFIDGGNGNIAISTCFVPYNEEFQPQIVDMSVPI